jgi:hypothetical protein
MQPAVVAKYVRESHKAWLARPGMDGSARAQFELISRKHGSYASWAVWAAATRGPKSNIDDLTILDVGATPTTLQVLKNDIIMVGLNISRSFAERFRNFHDPSPSANDFKYGTPSPTPSTTART